jgi:hypothetical protein
MDNSKSRISAQDTVTLFADLQLGIVELTQTNPVERLKKGVLALAKLAKLFDMPAIVSGIGGENGSPAKVIPQIAEGLAASRLLLSRFRPYTIAFPPIKQALALGAEALALGCPRKMLQKNETFSCPTYMLSGIDFRDGSLWRLIIGSCCEFHGPLPERRPATPEAERLGRSEGRGLVASVVRSKARVNAFETGSALDGTGVASGRRVETGHILRLVRASGCSEILTTIDCDSAQVEQARSKETPKHPTPRNRTSQEITAPIHDIFSAHCVKYA